MTTLSPTLSRFRRSPALGRPSSIRSALAACVFLAASLAGLPTALAQDLPAEIVASPSPLSPAQEQTVRDYAKPLLDNLGGDDAIKVRDGRIGLTKPLLRTGIVVGIPFRQAYSKGLAPGLDALVTGKRPLNAINALRVAAELATTEGFDLIDKGCASADPVVRAAAAAAAAKAFDVAAKNPSAAVATRLFQATNTLGNLIKNDPNNDVVDEATRALCVAFTQSTQAEVRNGACIALCQGISARAAKFKSELPKPRLLDALLRAGSTVRDDLTRVANQPIPLSNQATKSIQELGGNLIAFAARMIALGALPSVKQADTAEDRKAKEQTRVMISQIVGAGEQIVSLSAGPDAPRTNYAERIKKADIDADAQFLEAVKELLGPAGRMTKPPFNFPAGQFDLGK